MKVRIKHWSAVAQWRWNTGNNNHDNVANDDEGDVCGICRVPYEGCCPTCKMPGDDCPLNIHVFHMHCLLKWLGTPASKQQCPMDRRPWVTAERKVNNNTGNEAR
ncbi:anaphase-promoting complex subunit 11 [Pisolithus croceorrhizus]|nr:anaphase-promoting complex subunit 11 [Pisolithus croceorrhizus]